MDYPECLVSCPVLQIIIALSLNAIKLNVRLFSNINVHVGELNTFEHFSFFLIELYV